MCITGRETLRRRIDDCAYVLHLAVHLRSKNRSGFTRRCRNEQRFVFSLPSPFSFPHSTFPFSTLLTKQIHVDEPIPFIEVFVDIPVEEAEKRDPKGLYKKARAGEIPNFTGISAPYEAPVDAEITVHTDKSSVEECVQQIMKYLVEKKLLPEGIKA